MNRMILPVTLLLLSPASPVPLSAAEERASPQKKRPITDYPNLGVQLRPIRPGQENEGARINFIYPASSAKEMGLQVGDEVLEIDGLQVDDRKFLSDRIRKKAIGAPLRLKVRRQGKILELEGERGSFQKVREAFLEQCRKELRGKPFLPGCQLVWPDKEDGLRALRGKVAVVISFDNCSRCMGSWRLVQARSFDLQRLQQDWVGFCGIYFNIDKPFSQNLEMRNEVLLRYPVKFPVAVARYPRDEVPPDSAYHDSLIQYHGAAILDPEGKLLYQELFSFQGPPLGENFSKALQNAARKFGQPEEENEKESPREAPKN